MKLGIMNKGKCQRGHEPEVKTFHPPSIKQLFQSFLKKRFTLKFFSLGAGDSAMSTCHIVYFNKTGFLLPSFLCF